MATPNNNNPRAVRGARGTNAASAQSARSRATQSGAPGASSASSASSAQGRSPRDAHGNSPHAAGTRASSTHAGSARAAGPRNAGPRNANSHAAGSHAAGTHTANAHEVASTFGSKTHVGCVREHNEDSLAVAPPLYVVCDGMGGHAAGEVASEIAVTTIVERAPRRPDAYELGQAVEAANLAIIHAAEEGKGRAGMGTTCTAAMLENERLIIAQVGDSRAYLLHNGKLQQITRDHSLMADLIESGRITPDEARSHPQRSVITRALGSDPRTEPDLYEINVNTGDRLLLCSDGLSTMLEDPEIADIMRRTADPQRCADRLVDEAVAAGGHDNVTVVVVDVTGFAEVRHRMLALKTKLLFGAVLACMALVIGGAAFAFNYIMNNSAYLAEVDGYVAIYRGIPGEALGLSFSELEEITDVAVADLQPGLANRLAGDGVAAGSVEDARELVSSYELEIEARDGEGDSAAADANAADATSASSASAGSTDAGAASGASASAPAGASASTPAEGASA